MTRSFALAALAALTLTACDSTEADEVIDLNARTATDIEADLTAGRDPNTGAPISNNQFTFYDLDAGEVVLLSSETDVTVRQQDSLSTAWDIGFRGTEIIFNGGTSGPGQGSAQIVALPFDEVTEAPASGYVLDGQNTDCGRGANALCPVSDASWYNYDPTQNLVSAIPGRTIVLTTGEGDYAKVRILSYYQGNPTTPNPALPSRYYSFDYVVQPDGSRDFETTVVVD